MSQTFIIFIFYFSYGFPLPAKTKHHINTVSYIRIVDSRCLFCCLEFVQLWSFRNFVTDNCWSSSYVALIEGKICSIGLIWTYSTQVFVRILVLFGYFHRDFTSVFLLVLSFKNLMAFKRRSVMETKRKICLINHLYLQQL